MGGFTQLYRMARAIAPLALIAGFCWLLLEIFNAAGGVAAIRSAYGDRAAAVLFLILMVPPVPSEPLAAAIASLQGFSMGVALYWTALVARSAIEYGGARYFLSDSASRADYSKLPRRLQNLPLHHPVFLVSGRWAPLGNHIVSVAAGVARVRIGRFILCTALGTLPLAILIPAVATGVVWAYG